ncbi:autotransporter outer membrane beta-barrel domain-containing protein [Achromobacter xylosoxidans]|uniref:autotransporter outer membrane beta-barrel domain-containing protein n=8 Tax=Alcaligenes xylosoxydans xylosoxydans TaxID=85698 RepID=UPI0010414B61|nr:autotransporter outer membrane beta-barrel domain-containing protein [Achromobacter xylosoxidans]
MKKTKRYPVLPSFQKKTLACVMLALFGPVSAAPAASVVVVEEGQALRGADGAVGRNGAAGMDAVPITGWNPSRPPTKGANGARGGDGQSGIVGSGLNIVNHGDIYGGNGGDGGKGGDGGYGGDAKKINNYSGNAGNGSDAGNGGSGGNGGNGVSGSGLSITNYGVIAPGVGGKPGAGGVGGSGGVPSVDYFSGVLGKPGRRGANGLAGSFAGQVGNAITFNGGANLLTLEAGSRIIGDVMLPGVAAGSANDLRITSHAATGIVGGLAAGSSVGITLAGGGLSVDHASLASNATLSIIDTRGGDPNPESMLVVNDVSIGADVAFNLAGVSNAFATDKVLFRTTAGSIVNDFADVKIGGVSIAPDAAGMRATDYLTQMTAAKTADGKGYLATYQLSWFDAPEKSHGTFTVDAGGEFTVAAILEDVASNADGSWRGNRLTKAGSGALILAADNTYSGGTSIEGGTLQVGEGATAGSVLGDIANQGALVFNRSDAVEYGGVISGTGTVTKRGNGRLALTGANAYSGSTRIEGGTLQLGDGIPGVANTLGGGIWVAGGATLAVRPPTAVNVAGDVTFQSGSHLSLRDVRAADPSSGAMLADKVVIGNGATFDLADVVGTDLKGKVLFSTRNGIYGDFGSFTWSGVDDSQPDYLTWSARKSADSKQYLADYGLSWFAGNNLAHGTFTLDAGAQDTVSEVLKDVGANSALAWEGTRLTKKGDGALILSAGNTYGGGTTIEGGTLQFGGGAVAANTLGGNIQVAGGATLAIQTPATVSVAGDVMFQSGARLTLRDVQTADSPSGAMLADKAVIGNDVTLNLVGGGSAVKNKVLFSTRNGIEGDFASITWGGADDNRLDYLTWITRKSSDSKQYLADYGLSWFAGNNLAHGTFTLDAGAQDTVPEVLKDVGPNSVLAWEGTRLTKKGDGALILSADNTYSGGTTIAGGTLQLGAGGTTGSLRGDIVNDGALVFDRRNAVRYDGVVSGAGELVKRGTGALVLTGDHAYRGGTTIAAGTLVLGNGGFTGSLAVDGDIVNNGALIFDRVDTVTHAGAISGVGTLFKKGHNTLMLTGENTYTGRTTLEGGELLIGNGGASGSMVGDIAFTGISGISGDVIFDRSNASHYPGVISGAAKFTKNGVGTLTLSGHNAHTGGTLIGAGTLKTGVANAFARTSDVAVRAGAKLNLGGYSQIISQLDNSGVILFNDLGAPRSWSGVTVTGNMNNRGTLVLNTCSTCAGQVYTQAGDWAGNGGSVSFGTVLGGDDSKTDKLIITGDATGTTYVTVVNEGGSGSQTVEGIELIRTASSTPDAFVQQGRIVAGAYDYHLKQGSASGNNENYWYLTSLISPDDPVSPGAGTAGGGDAAGGGTAGGGDAAGGGTAGGGDAAGGDAAGGDAAGGDAAGGGTAGGGTAGGGTAGGGTAGGGDAAGGGTAGGGDAAGGGTAGGGDAAGGGTAGGGTAGGGTAGGGDAAGGGTAGGGDAAGGGTAGGGTAGGGTAGGGGNHGPHYYRPEIGSYAANLAAANTLFDTRLSDRESGESVDPVTGTRGRAWARMAGGHSHGSLSDGQNHYTAHRSVVQLGASVAGGSFSGDDAWRLGVMAGYGSQHSKARGSMSGYQSRGDITGYSAGVYGTWYQDARTRAGLYVDGWALFNRFDNTVKGDGLDKEQYTSQGVTASVEAGYLFEAGSHTTGSGRENRFYVRPQAQVLWSGVTAGDYTERSGTKVQGGSSGNVRTRLGARLSLASTRPSAGPGRTGQVEVFLDANWLHAANPYGVTMDDTRSVVQGGRNVVELRAGVEGRLTDRLSLSADMTQRQGSGGYRDTQGALNVKFRF